MVTISENIARQALSLAYSRMGQKDAQGDQASAVAAALYDALSMNATVAPLQCEFDFNSHCLGTDSEGGRWVGDRWCCAACSAMRRKSGERA